MIIDKHIRCYKGIREYDFIIIRQNLRELDDIEIFVQSIRLHKDNTISVELISYTKIGEIKYW